ncbi:23104_t:CDS:2 [Cetraspora pellucida]|uniref:Hexosyltransferase n=1 Tax=Cetraspora pellucida TaxID=1433469 RepID=A0A9N9DCX3_9GLOM|nr:23104_t:CDS:2 [Cetraspora pellucida]
MTYYEKIETRECLRKLYTHSNDALARYLGVEKSPVTIRFILGLPKDENKDKLEEESKMYGDVVILNITENMNKGKTFEYFNWFAKHREDNYMLKLDDDAFLHLIHYYRDLQDLPRERAYYGNAIDYNNGTYGFIGGAGYTLSRDLVRNIVGSQWVRSNVEGNEDWLVTQWSIRQNPIHDFDEDLDLHFFIETILIHQIKDVKKLNAIKDGYSEYRDGLPIVRVIRNSTAIGLITKRDMVPNCWTDLEKEHMWNQTLQNTYKNWFYEAWGFKERKQNEHYEPLRITR